MDRIGLRELRQEASVLVRRVENGDTIEITVSGRPAARLVPVSDRTWRSWREVATIFDGPDDPHWETDRAAIDDTLVDPWNEP